MKKLIAIIAICALTLAMGIGLAACGGAKTLDKPTLTVSGTTVTWAEVSNAKDYTLKIDGTESASATTTRTFSFASYSAGEHTIQVRANTNDSNKFKNSDWSEEKTVTVSSAVVTEPVETLEQFLEAITDKKGNFKIYNTSGGFFGDSLWEVNGNASSMYDDDAGEWYYSLIVGGDTWFGGSDDNETMNLFWNKDSDWVANLLYDRNDFTIFTNEYTVGNISDDDFDSVGNVHTFNLSSFAITTGELTSLVIEYLGDNIWEVTQTIDSVVYTFEIEFGAATLTAADFPEYTIP